ALASRGASDGFAERIMAQVAVTPITTTQGMPALSAISANDPLQISAVHRTVFSIRRFFEWLAVAGVALIMVAIFFPVFGKAREKSRHTQCMSNQKQIALGIMMYTQENHERLPDADSWRQEIGVADKVYHCTAALDLPIGIAYNLQVASRRLGTIATPETTPLTFDARNGQPESRHNDNKGIVMSFLDGHVEYVAKTRAQSSQGTLALVPAEPSSAVTARAPASIPTSSQPTIAPPAHNYGLVEGKLQIAYLASMTLESENVQLTVERSELLFRQFDGFVLTSEFQRGEQRGGTATVSGRLPAEKLGSLLAELSTLGTVTARSVNGEDLTPDALANVAKLQDLAGAQQNLAHIGARTRSTDQKLSIEELRDKAAREANGTREDEYRRKSRVTLAEVRVEIHGTRRSSPNGSYGATAASAWAALGSFARFLLTVLIPLLIWLPVWGPLLALGWFGYRRYRRQRRGS
ncbi:MAG TPA: DUF4349 domain-containing protein, partial [Armatimonadota bacterium]